MSGSNKSVTCECFCASSVSIRKLLRFEAQRRRQMYKEFLDKLCERQVVQIGHDNYRVSFWWLSWKLKV